MDLPGAHVAFSTRRGGVSEGPYESLNLGILTDDDRDRVDRNRELLAAMAGLDGRRIVWGWQVHGTDIQSWSPPPAKTAGSDPAHSKTQSWSGLGAQTAGSDPARAKTAGSDPLEKVDGHVTARDDLALLVIVADCLPVALAGERGVAMVHCGWRGLAGGIVANAAAALGSVTAAAVGPGIGPCCYEVGDEVRGRFEARFADGRMLDLRAVAEDRLRAAGVDRVEHIDLCTSCRDDLFFSHRRDSGVTGRQGGLAWRA